MKNKLHRHLVTCRLCHLSDKMWFASVRAETLRLINEKGDE